jgi:hypothetical protein
VNALDFYGDKGNMSEAEDSWGDNYCGPVDGEEYASSDDDLENVDWQEYATENAKGVDAEAQAKLHAERVCGNCKHYSQGIEVDYCECFWDNSWGTPRRLTGKYLDERAKNCDLYENKYG